MICSTQRVGPAISAGVVSLVVLASALTWVAAGVAAAEEKAAGPPGPLGDMVEIRSEGNDAGAVVQKGIDGIADETSELLSQYRTTLKQIDALDLYNEQMRNLITAQEEELASLSDQLERVQSVGRSVTPLMIRMIDAIERFVQLDVPFLLEERTRRTKGLHEVMGRADVTTAGKFRQIMEAYQIENEYGRTIEAYQAGLEQDGRETSVSFLRFGRVTLVYQSIDETEAGVWSQETRSWVPLDSSYRTAIRQGLRIARKVAAPDLIRLPVPAPKAGKGQI